MGKVGSRAPRGEGGGEGGSSAREHGHGPQPRVGEQKGGHRREMGAVLCRHWDGGDLKVLVFDIFMCFNK